MIKNWTSCFFQQNKKVAGITLKPLTVGDLVLLNQCKLIYDECYREGQELTLYDITSALLIFQYDFSFCKFILFNQKWSKYIYKWLYFRTRKKILKYGADKVHSEIIDYMNYYITAPSIRRNEKQLEAQPDKSDTPMCMRIITMFDLYWHKTEREVFNMGIDKALWYLAVRAELEGVGTLKDINTEEFEEWQKGIEELKKTPGALEKMVGPEMANKVKDLI